MVFFEKAKAGWIAEEVVQRAYKVCESPQSPPLINFTQKCSQCLRMIQEIRELGVWFMDGNSLKLLYSFISDREWL